MAVRQLTLLLVAVTALYGCTADPPNPSQRRRARPAMDKAALYGDAALMPTRRGERAREELALAGEIETAMKTVPELRDPHVSVTLGTNEERPGTALVAAQTVPLDEARRGTIERDLIRITGSVIPEVPTTGITVVLSEVESSEPASPHTLPQLPLAVAILGLGISLGVTGERIRRRRPTG